jgi:hypothetical protein
MISIAYNIVSLFLPPLYSCTWHSQICKSPKAIGGHMRKHRNELTLTASKERVNMVNKHNKIPMEILQPNREYWSKHTNGNKQKEIVFIPMKDRASLHREIKSSEKSSVAQNKDTKILGMESMGKRFEINSLDIDLKL